MSIELIYRGRPDVELELGGARPSIGIVAPSLAWADRVRREFGLGSRDVYLISTSNNARGRRLDLVIWVDKDRLDPDVIDAVEPALA